MLLGLVLVVSLAMFAISLSHYLGTEDDWDATSTDQPTAGQPAAPGEVPAPDYDPPAIPQPQTYDQATRWLVDNSVYDQTIAVPTGCTVPEVNITTASAAVLTEHLNDLTACLVRVWQQPLAQAGYQLPRPPVTVYTEPITTGCGAIDEVNAVYCAADQRIYYAKPLYQVFPKAQQRARFVAEMVIAHEFGHTIQARTGILVSSMAWEQESSTREANVFSRRLETQADCLSGMFTTAVADASGLSATELANLQKVAYALGDDVLTGQAGYEGNHGSGKARQRWFTAGQQSDDLATCNTYSVPASQVR